MPLYFIGIIEERNGEYEYQIPVRFIAASEKEASEMLTKSTQNWYGGNSQKDDDSYYFYGGEVCVQAGGYKEISESVYTALSRFVADAL